MTGVASGTPPLIEARGLAIGYGRRTVAHDIDMSLGAGEVVCLLGPNGSGKTTLFKTLLGLIARLGGSIAIDSRPIEAWPPQQLARRLAYVPQATLSAFPYRVLDMVLMGRTARLGLFSAPGEADRAQAWAALERLGIAHLAGEAYTRISGGQRQLALIARALAQEAPAIVMDEPTASLDFGNQALVLREVARLASSGLGVVLSTHHPDHAFAVGSRVLLLHDGRVIADGPPRQVLTRARLERVYGVAVTIDTHSDGRISCAPLLG
ncbi:MAG TPA: ABC transporter ATP-binding protein [Hyphomicrobiaceae bacterium]|nr:ABC transporter ATP-binding protein [Hyphomicrobiaceae bacterium]